MRTILVWTAFAALLLVPISLSTASPLLAFRQPIYILAGFAGILGMALLLVQPVLAGGYLPRVTVLRGRRIHRWTGAALVCAVILHVAGLWITSPPDMIDALLFRSPTPFSVWGVVAMWALFAAALLALFRAHLRPRHWRLGHGSLVMIVVLGSVIHAVLIEG
ncbi:MAG: ferric reductase, partial [Sulfitobacter sp.]|nr:ferric reductase [Sulfitobacter sp.]